MTQDWITQACFGEDIRSQNLRHVTLAQMQQEHQRQRAALEPRPDDVRQNNWASRAEEATSHARELRPALQWSRSHGEL